jgi:hypothetical protein
MPFARLVLMLGHHTRQSDAASRRLAMPMFEVPFKQSSEWNEFRHRAAERPSVVEQGTRSVGAFHSAPLSFLTPLQPL